MKKTAFRIALITGLVSGFLVASCSMPAVGFVTATGPVVTKDYNFTGFSSVYSGGVYQIELVPSESYSVEVTSNENIFDYIEVTKSGSTLRLGLRNGISITGPLTLKAKITMPELRGLELSGASNATVGGFKSAHDFRLAASGAARVDFDLETGKFTADLSGAGRGQGKLKAADTDIRLSGAANLQLEGSGANAVINGSGAASVGLSEFNVTDARVTLSGGSHGSINVSGKLDVNLSGGSTLQYGGSPTMGRVDVSGGSTLRHE